MTSSTRALCAVSLALGMATGAQAQDNCAHRGDLDMPSCDTNKDLVADPPLTAFSAMDENSVNLNVHTCARVRAREKRRL